VLHIIANPKAKQKLRLGLGGFIFTLDKKQKKKSITNAFALGLFYISLFRRKTQVFQK
jgi:hypothetical protein